MDIEGVANGIIRDSCTKLRDLFVSHLYSSSANYVRWSRLAAYNCN